LNKSILVILILFFLSCIFFVNTQAASDKTSMEVKSRMLKSEKVPVIIILKDTPSFRTFSKENAVNELKNRTSTSQQALADLLKEEKGRGKADKIKEFWIVNAIAVDSSPELIEKLSMRNDVMRIELDEKFHITDDYSMQVSHGQIDNSTSEIRRINTTKVWELGIDGTGIKVSVIDTGINASHPDIGGRVIKGYDFVNNDDDPADDNGHGTHVAGTIGGNGSQGTTTGVAPNVSLFGAKVLDVAGYGYESNVIRGIEWSVSNGANLISMSLSGERWVTSNCDLDNSAMATAINNAVASNVVIVASAGNNASGVSSPGCIQKSIAVGAVDGSDTIAIFSGRGLSMTDHGVVAPGVGITSLDYASSGYLAGWNGTSMATPHISGTVALILHAAKRQGTTLLPSQIKNILTSTSIDLGAAGNDPTYGAGRINVSAAVFSIDTVDPFVIANPTGYTIGNTAARNGTAVTLNATITDAISGVKNASVNVSGINASLGSVSLFNISGFWLNNSVIVNASDGQYYLNVTAYDNVSNVNNTIQLSVILDNNIPLVIANPTGYSTGNTAARNGTSVTLNASITDAISGVRNASVNVSGINASLGSVSLFNISGFWINNSVIVNASDGQYYLNVTAYDNASNVNSSVQLSIPVDNSPPLVYINQTSYQRGSAANNGSIIGLNTSANDPLVNGISTGLKNASVNISLINKTGIIELSNFSGFWKGNATFDNFTADGDYSLNVTFFDIAGNINNTFKINISIDNTPPSVTNVSLSSQFINISSFTNISANIISLDRVSQVNGSEVFARVTYPNGTSINYLMNAGGGSLFYYNFTDTAQYGRFNVTILANDTVGNINNTQRIQFATAFITNNESVVIQADNSTVVNAYLSNTSLYLFTNNTSVGTINITQSRINITSNELNITNPGIYVNVNISSSIRNYLSYVIICVNYSEAEISSYSESTLRLYRWNTSSSSWDRLSGAGSYPYVNNAGVDTTNNFVWANLTWMSEFAVSGDLYVPLTSHTTISNGGGSSGGGGGGTTGENYSNIEIKEKNDMHIFKDKVTSYRFNSTDPIMYVNITGNINAGEVTTMVELLKATSALVKNTSAPGLVYKNMNIWGGTAGFAVPENIKEGVIGFRVRSSWFEENSLAISEVRMVRWNSSGWEELETMEKDKDMTYAYFEAKTHTFSPFAITAFKTAALPAKVSQNPVIPQETQTSSGTRVQPEKAGFQSILTVISLVLAIIVVLLAAIYLKEKKKKNK
jgi:serine protease AprX